MSVILGSRIRTVRFNIALRVVVVRYATDMEHVWMNQNAFVSQDLEVLDVMSCSVMKKIATAGAHAIKPRVYAHAKMAGEVTPAR